MTSSLNFWPHHTGGDGIRVLPLLFIIVLDDRADRFGLDAMTDCILNAGYEPKHSGTTEGSHPWFRIKGCTFWDLNAWLVYHLKYTHIHGDRYPPHKVWHRALRAANARTTRWRTQVIRIPGYRATEYTLDLKSPTSKKLYETKITNNPCSQPMSSQPSDGAIRAATMLACAPAEESSSEDDATSDGSYGEDNTITCIGESDLYHESRQLTKVVTFM